MPCLTSPKRLIMRQQFLVTIQTSINVIFCHAWLSKLNTKYGHTSMAVSYRYFKYFIDEPNERLTDRFRACACMRGVITSSGIDFLSQPAFCEAIYWQVGECQKAIHHAKLSTVGNRPQGFYGCWNTLPEKITTSQALSAFCQRLRVNWFSRKS